MIGIDLFAGVGGMTRGAIQAGIDVKFAVELDVYAASAYLNNNPYSEVFVNDIRHLTPQRIKQVPRGSSGTIVFGGPPCQGFSYSNSRTRGAHNENNWLFEHFVRVVKIWHPDFLVLENVQGIINTAGGLICRVILDQLDQLGYELSFGTLDALDFGVPQRRSRFFVIGSRTRKIELPPKVTLQPTTVKDAISDLPNLVNGAAKSWLSYGEAPPSAYAKKLRSNLRGCSSHLVTKNGDRVIRRYKFVPPGGNWEDIPSKMMGNYKDRNRCHTGIYHRLRYDRPSVVIGNYRKNMLIHPLEDRGLSVREAARIQSFPDSYEFAGSIGFQQQQVGNAVPPLLAQAVFRQVIIG